MNDVRSIPGSARSRALRERHASLIAQEPGLRLRDAAARLEISEAELLASGAAGPAHRLRPQFGDLFRAVPTLGRVMALTRNDGCVHERKGRYEDVRTEGHVALVLGPDIDLRIFLHRFAFAFAVRQESPRGALLSLQFFDRHGVAVHKIFLIGDSDTAAFEALSAAHRDPDAPDDLVVERAAPAPAARADAEIDVAALRAGWETLQDTHDFFPLLGKLRVGREQALRLGGARFAQRVGSGSCARVLQDVARDATPIMVFTGSPGVIQIHTGPVHQVKTVDRWLNVLDPDFNLHLDTSAVATAWRVRKPTRDGVVTALELYDARGELLVQFFGRRKPGQQEDGRWRALVESLPLAGDPRDAAVAEDDAGITETAS